MSDEIAIRVENLSKRYRIGAKEEVHDTLAGMLGDWVKRPGHNMRRLRHLTKFSDDGQDAEDILWALKDVSFGVKRGEVVGIIGRNGAGKSTLLKILSRITHPTSGRVELNGRVSSLLEVGTGFHPELTGRENVYLNGTILGMRKAEIDRKFDEIIDFSGIEQFIDTLVKRYSSGMGVRLAFAIAAHLEPEILLVDEVLAVGDTEFQRKCISKMEDVTEEGRTVLFVSHNMGAIVELCPNCILINKGRIEKKGPTDQIVSSYLKIADSIKGAVELHKITDTEIPICFTRIWVSDEMEELVQDISTKVAFTIGLQLHVRRQITALDISIRIQNQFGQSICTTNLSDFASHDQQIPLGNATLLIKIPPLFFAPDTYSLTIAAHVPNAQLFDFHENVLSFRVVETGSKMWRYDSREYGNVFGQFRWKIAPESD